MKVLDLQCGLRHSFEGWFGSEEAFQSQLARGLVECPMCADKAVVKMPSAPRLNTIDWSEVAGTAGGNRFTIRDVEELLERAGSKLLAGWGQAKQGLPDL